MNQLRGHGCGRGKAAEIEMGVTIPKRLEGDQFRQLHRENLWMASEMMNQALRGLLILSKVSTLVESTRVRGIHEEIWRPVQLNDKSSGLWRASVGGGNSIGGFQNDVFDIRERILDFVSSRVVIDVVGHAGLLGGVEDDQVHGTLAHTAPRPNAQRTTRKMASHYIFCMSAPSENDHRNGTN